MENKENLSLEILDHREIKCLELIEKSRGLTIDGVEDLPGYKAVHEARMAIIHEVSAIHKDGKFLRDATNRFNKSVLEKERYLEGLVSARRDELQAEEDEYNKQIERQKRQELLPDRQKRLGAFTDLGLKHDMNAILDMDASQFQEYLNELKHIQLDKQEAAIKAENDRLAAERDKLEKDKEEARIREEERLAAQKKAKEELELAAKKAEKDKADAVEAEKKKAAEEKAKIERDAKEAADKAERDRLAAIQKVEDDKKAAVAKVEKEKQDIIDENNRKDAKRIKDEKDKKAADEERIKKEAALKRAEMNQKNFQDFLRVNGANRLNIKTDFRIEKEGNDYVVFKKIGTVKME